MRGRRKGVDKSEHRFVLLLREYEFIEHRFSIVTWSLRKDSNMDLSQCCSLCGHHLR